jgi:hypothetical protein
LDFASGNRNRARTWPTVNDEAAVDIFNVVDAVRDLIAVPAATPPSIRSHDCRYAIVCVRDFDIH